MKNSNEWIQSGYKVWHLVLQTLRYKYILLKNDVDPSDRIAERLWAIWFVRLHDVTPWSG
jgi:hypothetical protein